MYNGTTILVQFRISNGAPLLLFDINTFPAVSGYVGQVYRDGTTLKIRTV